MGPLPACRYDDILTEPRAYDDWSITLVDTILRVSSTYAPPDLESVADAGISGSGEIREVAIADLRAMAAAAKAAGNPIGVQSAYRSYTTQEATFQYWVNLSGYDSALLYSARPGHSEHQLGLAIDFKSAAGGAPWSGSDWGLSPAGKWMRTHAWEYGWVESYPKGKEAVTCYAYEAWHYRYVGRDLAADIHASGLTPREYLWAHFTTAVVPGPAVSAKPSASPVPSPSPSPVATATPSPSPSPVEPTLVPTDAPVASPAVGPASTSTGLDAGAGVAIGAMAAAAAALAATLLVRRRRRSTGPTPSAPATP